MNTQYMQVVDVDPVTGIIDPGSINPEEIDEIDWSNALDDEGYVLVKVEPLVGWTLRDIPMTHLVTVTTDKYTPATITTYYMTNFDPHYLTQHMEG